MDPTLQSYAVRPTPRYTSYPTAPHFSDAVGAAEYEGWLKALDPDEAVSLYLHLPFCRQVCWYCGCNMKLASNDGPIVRYVDTLLQEIDLVAGKLPGRPKVSCLHWGGGTPTAMRPEDMERAMAALRARFDFTDGAELALESDPRTLTPEMVRTVGRLGFNRASFGVQEFDPKVQAAINRIQPPEMVRASVDALRAEGVEAINFDLIYGLPHQTVATIRETIQRAAEMRPNRLAIFGYAHVPWMAKKQRMIDEAALPGAAERMEQAAAAADAIRAAGYIVIGLDHFALPDDPMADALAAGRLRRNFQGYTTDEAETLIGLGATSIGRTPSGYVQNIAETGAWRRAVEAGTLPVAKGVAFSGEDRLRGHVIERLMCMGEVDLAEARRRFGAGPHVFDEALAELQGLQVDGLLRIEGERIRMTGRGRPLVRIAAAAFDAYLAHNAARHSVAV